VTRVADPTRNFCTFWTTETDADGRDGRTNARTEGMEDAWRGCGFRIRERARTVRLPAAEDAGDGRDGSGVTLRISMKDLTNEGGDGDGDDDDDASGSESASEEAGQDPYFFEPGYTIAATTGFCRVWEGAATLSQYLEHFPNRVVGKRVVELGAGVGECGLVCAALGADVVMTDVEVVAENVIRRNILQNATPGEASTARPGAWPRARLVGRGSAAHATLDWMDPLPTKPVFVEADVIIAAECVWLRELVEPFANTVVALLRGGVSELILSIRDRSSTEDASSGKAFASTGEVFRLFKSLGCAIEELYKTASEDEGKDIIIARVALDG
jgi:predicted nicotinamide N-methyase